MPNNNLPANTIPFDNAHTINYFEKGIDAQGPYYNVEYLTSNWNNADAFVNFLLGIKQANGPTVSTIQPHRHPLSPNLFCREAKVVEGLGPPVLNAQGYPFYAGGALIRAVYRPMVPMGFEDSENEQQQQIDPNTPLLWCTQEIELTCEAFTIPSLYLKWPDGSPTTQQFRLFVPVTYMNLTFHKVPFLPATLIKPFVCRVNSSTFLNCAPGTVLFKNAGTTRDWQSDGTVAQKVRLNFAQRDAGQPWNALPNPKAGLQWQVVKATGQTMYLPADLNQLVGY